MKLSIIIINFNTKELLKSCLESIFLASCQKKQLFGQLEVIVVDNNSVDGSQQMVKKDFAQVRLIENKTNFGFSRAVNQGIKKAKGKYILLLNSDILVRKKRKHI